MSEVIASDRRPKRGSIIHKPRVNFIYISKEDLTVR